MLDAALFERAAPGLRDVRLVQDGHELPYATDISLDDRSTSAAASSADRSLYETAMVVPAHPSHWPDSTGDTSSRPEHPSGSFYGRGLLPAHVPVERIRLDSSDAGTEFFSLRAAEAGRIENAETIDTTLTRENPSVAFTVGANLQRPAEVGLGVHGQAASVSAFVLEMRRREICYQPLTASPVTLLFGNSRAMPVRYDYGRYFHPKATPLLSSMGPIQPNPAFHEPRLAKSRLSLRTKLALGALACAFALLLTLRPLLRAAR